MSHTAETKAKISAALAGIKKSPELRKKWSDQRRGVKRGPQPNISKALSGRPKAPEHVALAAARSWTTKRAKAGGAFKHEQNPAERYSPKHRAWKAAVLEAYGRWCSRCGSADNLHVHHKLTSEWFPELQYEVANGAVVCRKCHPQVEHDDRNLVVKILRELVHLGPRDVFRMFLERRTR
jgi:hypothetical protein